MLTRRFEWLFGRLLSVFVAYVVEDMVRIKGCPYTVLIGCR